MAPTKVSDHAVGGLRDRWFPEEAVVFTRMESGSSTPVYRVVRGEDIAYLRLAEHPGEIRDGEVQAHRLAIATGVCVPAILRWEPEPPELDRSAALTTAMPGVPLGEYEGDPLPAAREAGRQLARFNAIPVTGWGWVDHVGEDGNLIAEHPDRVGWAIEYLAAVDTVVASGILDASLHAPLRDAAGRWAALASAGQSCLAHGDCDGSHIYVDPESGQYQGMIDLGEIRGADRAYDLGHALIHHRPERAIASALIDGYREIVPVSDDEVRTQAIAIAIRALAIRLDREPNAYRAQLVERLATILADTR